MTTQIISELVGGIGTITLNRPERINALSRTMIDELTDQLRVWATAEQVERVVLRGAGERGFCAGADVRELRQLLLDDRPADAVGFLHAEYALDELIAGYPKPVTAQLVGVAMGGGLGIGIHNTHRVGATSTRWAMPETAIGLWPDVGVCYELSRAPGRIGEYLAMTGQTIDGASALFAGLLDECPAADPQGAGLAAEIEWIDQCYQFDDAVSIVQALKTHPNPAAQQAATVIEQRSPLSVAVALAALRRARALPDVAAVLDQDRILGRTMLAEPHDFIEGVRAKMVDRDDQPRWRHACLADVDPAEVAARFVG